MIGDRLGTARMCTTCNTGEEGTFASLPFGDGQASATNGTDANHCYTTAASSAGATTHFERTDWHGPP
jgi:hypothetical protein